MAKSININHIESGILTNDGTFVQISQNGGVKVGYGKNLEEPSVNNTSQSTLAEYNGAIRINETTNKLEYCNGKAWVELVTEEDNVQTSMVYSLLF